MLIAAATFRLKYKTVKFSINYAKLDMNKIMHISCKSVLFSNAILVQDRQSVYNFKTPKQLFIFKIELFYTSDGFSFYAFIFGNIVSSVSPRF